MRLGLLEDNAAVAVERLVGGLAGAGCGREAVREQQGGACTLAPNGGFGRENELTQPPRGASRAGSASKIKKCTIQGQPRLGAASGTDGAWSRGVQSTTSARWSVTRVGNARARSRQESKAHDKARFRYEILCLRGKIKRSTQRNVHRKSCLLDLLCTLERLAVNRVD